jgi:hypothetical protein
MGNAEGPKISDAMCFGATVAIVLVFAEIWLWTVELGGK